MTTELTPPELTPKELKQRLERHEPLVLLDVRQDWETRLCRLDINLALTLGDEPQGR